MLYPKNQEPVLSDELFRSPTSEYRGTPFWAWNCELNKEELLWQLDVLKKMGMGGAHMHVRTGLETPYLGDTHMEMVKACVEKCRDEKMLAWLYDEDRWPSGAAGGIVTREEKYRARFLMITAEPYQAERKHGISYDSSSAASRAENGYLLACYDVVLDENGCLKSGRRIAPEEEARGTKWYAYVETPNENPWFNNQTYVNTLDDAAMRRFIEVTYERYLETVGEDFGGVVPAIFTDEPQFSFKGTLDYPNEKKDIVLPWVEDLPDTFREETGLDLLAGLPELLWELPDGKVSALRYHYHDHTCERFSRAFADQCGSWCEDHGLMLTGHMMEEPTLRSQTAALGEAMRSYRSFQLPGIDMLCNGTEFTTAKQAQSASRQFGREGVLSELYGVTGWDFDFRGHKFQGDWQAALGVTVRVPHLSWVSMKGEAKRDYPASIHYQSPWWQDYSYVEDHFARVNTAMTRGSALVRVGVIHPVESYWLHYGPSQQTAQIRDQMDRGFQDLTRWLLEGSMDFDFISESLLPIQCAEGSAPLKVGHMAYDAIVVPGCETLRTTTLERLEAFRAAGGTLIFLGEAPKYVDALPSQRAKTLWEGSLHRDYTQEGVLGALESFRMVDIRREDGGRTEDLIHQLRCDGPDRWLFLAHSRMPYHKDVPRYQDVRIQMEGIWQVKCYDTVTGGIRSLAAEREDGRTTVRVRLHDLDSLLLRYAPGEAEAVEEAVEVRERRVLPVGKRVKYSLSEPNVLLLDKAGFKLDDGPWHPETELLRADNVLREQLGWPSRQASVAQPWTIHEPKPEHTVTFRFWVECTQPVVDTALALEDAALALIFVDGRQVTAPVDGWYTDKAIGTVKLGSLETGIHTLDVVLPFGRRTNVEWCYLLGSFGVDVAGEYRVLTAPRNFLGFDDVVKQGLAHYGGNITYHLPLTTRGGDIRITLPHFAGTAVRVELAGREGIIAYPPYRLELKDIAAGDHDLKLTLLGNRFNSFGAVHLADLRLSWHGPDAWRTRESSWTESYRLKPLGILSAPLVEEAVE